MDTILIKSDLSRLRRLSGKHQQGVSLMLSMVVLLVLSVLGLSAIQNSTLQERMANNLRDRNVALQAAELALRDAERDLKSVLADDVTFCPAGGAAGGVTCRSVPERATVATDVSGFWIWTPSMQLTWTPTCTDGQCLTAATTVPVWDDTAANWSPQTSATSGFPTIQYGTYTGATPIANVAAQPRYILEIIPPLTGTGKYDTAGMGSAKVVIRITVRAVGQNANTVVMLQSVIVPS